MNFSGLIGRGVAAWRSDGWRAVRCRVDRLWLGGLRRVLKFDVWHASAPYSCRPYKRKVVELANALQPEMVVEVGCGLGDILSRVKARERFGFDTDLAVVRAARCLHPVRARWIHGDASSVVPCTPQGRRIDCLIMVNWIHNLSPERLAACLLPLLPRVGHLIVDSIDPDASPSYSFRHDFKFLRDVAERVSIARVAGEPRSFVVFKVVR
jgi:SAM-dependent methyltransferase